MSTTDAAKKAAGEHAASFVDDGMCIGFGTGSTTAYTLSALGQRVRDDGLHIQGVPTSFAAERLARQHGLPLVTLDDVVRLDLAIDGADEVDPDLNLIKGRGAAHTREKVIAAQAERFIIVVDPGKQVDRLGTDKPLPVEVLPMAAAPVMRALNDLGATPDLRMGSGKDGPVVTDQGLWILDAHFADGLPSLSDLNRTLLMLPGVLDHGLFLGLATDVLVGQDDGTVNHLSR